jgi:D-tyrosyl-tRNA(Tyr) deacylase
MKAVIQRVSRARVTVSGGVTGEIGVGLVVLLGIHRDDGPEDLEWLCGKIARLRVFEDAAGDMNLSVVEANGGLLVVSQFTLIASTRKGNRPSFNDAARPEVAIPLYTRAVACLGELLGRSVATGEFGAMMDVELVNAGPVTITIDSRARE